MSTDKADLVVGIASWNDAATIGPLASAVTAGLEQSGATSCIVVADGGSTDGTVEIAGKAVGSVPFAQVAYSMPRADPLRSPYHGLPGRPAAIRALLEAAVERDAKACALLDASLTSLTPEWIPRLLGPIVDQSCDYVSPYYARGPEEGAITKSIVYPLFRALYGIQVRQPAAGEFGCSMRFIRHALDQTIWDGEDAQTAIDVWLVSTAVAEKMGVAEAALGPRSHALRTAAPDVSTTLAQVVGAVFADVEAHASIWQRVRGSTPVPVWGEPSERGDGTHGVNIDEALDGFRLGCRALREVWAWIVQPKAVLLLEKLATAPADRFQFGDELWTEIIYDFALAYRQRTMPRDQMLRSLTPLYLGYLAGFARQVRGAPPADVDDRIERLCLVFEAKKPRLISQWRWPERFRA